MTDRFTIEDDADIGIEVGYLGHDGRLHMTSVSKAAARLSSVNLTSTEQRNIDLAKLTKAARKALPASDFVFPKTRRYPIQDKAHAHAALIDSLGKPEHAVVVAAVRKRYGWMK